MNNFEDIRPYHDDEVKNVVNKLHKEDELIVGVAKYSYPKLFNISPIITKALIRFFFKKKSKSINKVSDFQNIIGLEFSKILKKTCGKVTISGLEKLDKNQSYLFIGNHRDIVMDPALVSYLLYKANHNTVEIAIGDNLLNKEYISDLMRLNKSFIVKRSLSGREKLLSLKKLSSYINYKIKSGDSIWIAQKEGRAKDGIDYTDPAIIKMLQLGVDSKKIKLNETINSLNIIPVSISYELDPCDSMKAEEIYMKNNNITFIKDKNADQKSISRGLLNFKGNIHVSFGDKIKTFKEDPKEIAKEIDKQIINNYLLQAPNYIAYEKLHNRDSSIGPKLHDIEFEVKIKQKDRENFNKRISLIQEDHRPILIKMYANPVINKLNQVNVK